MALSGLQNFLGLTLNSEKNFRRCVRQTKHRTDRRRALFMLHEAGHSRGQLHSDVLLLCMLECSRRQRFCVIIIIINIILLLLLFFYLYYYYYYYYCVSVCTVTIVCIPLTTAQLVYAVWLYGELLCKASSYLQGIQQLRIGLNLL